MSIRQTFFWLSAIVALNFVSACVSIPTPTEKNLPQPSQSANVEEINQSLSVVAAQSSGSSADYRIGPDDLVQVTIYNIPEQEARLTPRTVILRVSQEGVIVVPLVGAVEVKGKTTAQVEQDLRTKYAKYIRSPQVGVLITEYRQRASVMGAVQKPGVFELTGPKSVIDMVALAGGITEKAGNQVHVYRQDAEGKRQSFVIDLLALANPAAQGIDQKNAELVNLPVQPGDVINVPQSGMFFVDGAVGKPGSYPLGRQYTLTQALATAGGVNPELADYSSVSIFRRKSPTNIETISVDLDNIMSGSSQDVAISADDVIVVPISSAKYFVKRFIGTIVSGFSVGSMVR